MARQRGFSLIEMVIVITIIGLLGAIAVGRLSHFAYRAKVSSAAASVLNMAMKVDEVHAIEGDYPDQIEPAWFVARKLPTNPFAPNPKSAVEISDSADPAEFHPEAKVYLADGSKADTAYWYNPANGAIRARVANRSTVASTIKLYNVVNGADVGFLAQTDQYANEIAAAGVGD